MTDKFEKISHFLFKESVWTVGQDTYFKKIAHFLEGWSFGQDTLWTVGQDIRHDNLITFKKLNILQLMLP